VLNFKSIKEKDVEKEQSILRCFILAIVTIYLFLFPDTVESDFGLLKIITLFYLSISIALYLWINYKHDPYQPRVILFTILDQSIGAYACSFGLHAIPIVSLIFWVMIGSAFRFGFLYLYISASAAVLGFLYNIYFSPEWVDASNYGWGYLLSIVVVAFYSSVFLSRFSEANKKLNSLARVDSLTELPNRLSLVEHLTQSIALTQRMNTYVSLLYFDLDGFKKVNDTLGHAHGDLLLKEVAHRVKARLRSSDMLARLGGDEFVVVLENTQYPKDAIAIAQTILDITSAIEVEGVDQTTHEKIKLHVGASIGISTYGVALTDIPPTVNEFIKQADDAMYAAKKAGKGCYQS
jgi:diguanylate cyclase (GGDEF)-like protein